MTTIKSSHRNGNSNVTIYSDGTREISFPDLGMILSHPLNVDIRVSNRCSFGYNSKTKSAICSFCHESATTDGDECDYQSLKMFVIGLIKGTELAIGCNHLSDGLEEFIIWASNKGLIMNLTINQGHLNKYSDKLHSLVQKGYVSGIGVSYRKDFKFKIPNWIIDYDNTVFHVIAGIDDIEDIKSLSASGVSKILVLGEKDFGFNQGNVDLSSKSHKAWKIQVRDLFELFKVVSFDNLALEQLNVRRFFNQESWGSIYQGEYSFYIDAVQGTVKANSRSNKMVEKMSMTNPKKYFNKLLTGA